MFNHVMIDLETLSSRNNAAIISIGAVRMDLENFKLGEEFYVVITPSSSQRAGLHIDADTVTWWMEQSAEAQKVLTHPKALDIYMALQAFSWFIASETVDGVWGHGSTFDNVILRNAYEACHSVCPWKYREDLCFRTMRKLFHLPKPEREQDVEHHALDDARRQAQSLVVCLQRLRRLEAADTEKEKL